MKFRYGSIPKKNLEEIKKQIDNINAIMFEIREEKDVVWIMYFTTEQYIFLCYLSYHMFVILYNILKSQFLQFF